MKTQTLQVIIFALLGYSLLVHSLPMARTRRSSQTEEVNIVVQEGDPINIDNCEADSNSHVPTIHWLFNGEFKPQGPLDNIASNLISPNVEQVEVKLRSTINIKHARPEHSGKYTCVADTLIERTSKSYNVIVQQSATKKPTEVEVSEESELRIYEWTASLMQVQGKTLYAVCRATQGTTNVLPTVKWTLNGRELTETDNVKLHSNGDLEVIHVPEEYNMMSGDLKCKAISSDGHSAVEKTVYVYVFEPESDDTNSS